MPADLVQDLIARWPEPVLAHVPLLGRGGISAVLVDKVDPAFAGACKRAGIQIILTEELQFVDAASAGAPRGSKAVALTEGSLPGIARDPAVAGRDVEVASASREPWVELSAHWVPYLKALHPAHPAVLAYSPDPGSRAVPFDAIELAFLEARSFGGNCILPVEPVLRKALLAGDAKALAAWDQLGHTARWLRENQKLLGQGISPIVTQVVEPGEETPEIAKLLYRRNVSPALEAAAGFSSPDPNSRRLIVAVDLKSVDDGLRKRILAHASGGATVVANGTAWPTAGLRRIRSDEDRDVFEIGKGLLVVYREAIADPSEFAMDVIDLLTHKRRSVRVWNAAAAVALGCEKGVLRCINYGAPVNSGVQVRMQGAYSQATLYRPEAVASRLKVAIRGTTTEITIPELRRFAIVVFR